VKQPTCALSLIAATLIYGSGGLPPAAAGSAVENRDAAMPGRFLTVGYTLSNNTDFDDGGDAALETKETRIVAGLLPGGSAARGFDLGLDYQYTRYTYDGIDSRNRDLHRLQVPLGVRTSTGNWRIDTFIAPGIATSSNVQKDLFARASSDDFFATARIEATSATHSRSGFVGGIAWDRSFGEPRIYPIVGVDYRPSANFHARVAFPDPAVRFAASERQTWTLRLYPAGFEWHVLDDDLVTEFDYRVEAWRAEAWWSLRAWRSVFVDLSLGYEFDRRHEFTGRAGTRITQNADDAILFTVGLRWRAGPLAPTHRIARSTAP